MNGYLMLFLFAMVNTLVYLRLVSCRVPPYKPRQLGRKKKHVILVDVQ